MSRSVDVLIILLYCSSGMIKQRFWKWRPLREIKICFSDLSCWRRHRRFRCRVWSLPHLPHARPTLIRPEKLLCQLTLSSVSSDQHEEKSLVWSRLPFYPQSECYYIVQLEILNTKSPTTAAAAPIAASSSSSFPVISLWLCVLRIRNKWRWIILLREEHYGLRL